MHKKLKEKLKNIMSRCCFVVDREVQLNLGGEKDEKGKYEVDRSIDVLAYFEYEGCNCMFFFECKGGSSLKSPKKEISAWENDIRKILNHKNSIRVINSLDKKITISKLRKVDDIKLCFVFSQTMNMKSYKETETNLSKKKINSWSYLALKYYDRISSALGHWTKYEIFREFGLYFEPKTTYRTRAIRIKQKKTELYVCGLHPGLLLKISYVSRRTSTKSLAYQRIISKDRINKISEFISLKNSLLPNAVIIVFDNSNKIQREIEYKNGFLYFPIVYCSAWIIDGQHRIYGFLDTKYEEWDEQRNGRFVLPVVVFRKLDESIQNMTFVNINYFQKRINPTLLCDLATVTKDITNVLTWPSLLAVELNNRCPLKGSIKVSELDSRKPITLSGFARYGLLESLLGFNTRTNVYTGPLYKYAPFNTDLSFKNQKNQDAFKRQLQVLQRFFKAVEKNTRKLNKTRDPWTSFQKYGLLKTTGINALFLALSRIMETYPNLGINLDEYLKPLIKVGFSRKQVARQGGGWKGFRNLANIILRALNKEHKDNLRLYGKKEKL